MLYTKNNSYPKPIPFRIVLSDGTTRTDPSTFTDEEISNAGYVLVDNPPSITEHQTISWNGTEWVINTKSAEEIAQELEMVKQSQWELVRHNRDQLMKEFEWRYIRYDREVRLGLTPTDNIVQLDTYMQALADITQQEDPYNIVWPDY